jgi:hypothetical protein
MSETASEASRGHGEDGPDDLGQVLQHRRKEISERIEQLHEREQQLADRMTGERSSPGTLPEAAAHAAEAKAHAEDGHMHAAEAHERASGRYAVAAEVHERVADVLDSHDRHERARTHREAVEHDRDAAAVQKQAAEDE